MSLACKSAEKFTSLEFSGSVSFTWNKIFISPIEYVCAHLSACLVYFFSATLGMKSQGSLCKYSPTCNSISETNTDLQSSDWSTDLGFNNYSNNSLPIKKIAGGVSERTLEIF